VDLEGDEAGTQSAAPDAELLMTVLEAREVIEEAQCEEDLEEVRVANEERIDEAERRIGEALESEDVQAAKEEAVRLRYWVNIREGVKGWERGKPLVLQH
jgi:molecular chaperone HscB